MAETDRDQLYEALRRADAAGDTEAARRLAEYIGSLPSTDYQAPRRQGEIERTVRAVGGRAADVATGAAQWARDAYMGPGDLPDLPEFNAPAPTSASTASAAFGLMMSNNPAAQTDILKEQYPGIQFETAASGETGDEYIIADWTDETGQRHRGYVNAPGLTGRDMAGLAGQAAAYVPAARFGQGAALLTGAAKRAVPSLLGRMTRTGVATGATRAALDKAVEPLGSEQGINPAEVAVTGAAGAAAEVAAPLVSGAYRAIRGNPLRSGEGLSGQGQRLAGEAGLDPSQMPPPALREFARVAEGGDTQTAARAAELAEFNIPASRGQISQSYPQLNLEERMRRGLEGPEAEAIVKGLDTRQVQAIDDAVGSVQGRLQPRPSADVPEAQSRFLSGVQGAERAAGQRVDDAYGAMRAMGDAAVPVPPRNDLTARFTQALESSDAFADPNLTPATLFALKQIDERIGAGSGSVSLADFEKARRVINGAANASQNAADRRGVLILKRELDSWLDETVDNGLMAGDPGVVDALKAARAARAEYGRLFEARGPDDVSGKIVERIVDRAETPEMAMNYLFGQGSLAGKAEATGAARRLRDILGEDSDGWNAVREAAWNRIARDAQGKARTPAMFQKEWNNFNLRNRSLRDALFSSEEVALMNRYRQALGRTDRPPTNPSQTAFAAETALRQVMRGLGQRERITGNVATGTMINFLSRMPLNPFGAADYARRMAAAKALSPVPGGARPLTAPVAGGTAAIDQMQR